MGWIYEQLWPLGQQIAEVPPSRLTHVDEDGQQKESGRSGVSHLEYDLGQLSARSNSTLRARLGVMEEATRARSRKVDGARAVISTSVVLAMLALAEYSSGFESSNDRRQGVGLGLYYQRIWQSRNEHKE